MPRRFREGNRRRRWSCLATRFSGDVGSGKFAAWRLLRKSAKPGISTVLFKKPSMLLYQGIRSGDLDEGDEDLACPRAQGCGCGRLRGSRFAEGSPALPVESLEHLDVVLGKIGRHSRALRDPAEFIGGELDVPQGSADDQRQSRDCFIESQVRRTEQPQDAMTLPGVVNQSRGRLLGDVARGDHGEPSMARVQPVELAVPPDRVELGQEVFHEETGSQVENIVRSVIRGAFDIVQTGDWPEPIGPVRPEAGEVHDPGDAIDSYRPGDGIGSLAVPGANVRGGKVGRGKPEEDVRPLGGSGKGRGVVRRGLSDDLSFPQRPRQLLGMAGDDRQGLSGKRQPLDQPATYVSRRRGDRDHDLAPGEEWSRPAARTCSEATPAGCELLWHLLLMTPCASSRFP